MKTFFCWPLLSGVRIVTFYDIGMSVITTFFLLFILLFKSNDGGKRLVIYLFKFLLVITPRGIMGIINMKKEYPRKLAKYY